MPVVAANRIGIERVVPCRENNMQESALQFFGSSFITDETGAMQAEASRDHEEVLVVEFDLDEIASNRLNWGLFRDRRPQMYQDIIR